MHKSDFLARLLSYNSQRMAETIINDPSIDSNDCRLCNNIHIIYTVVYHVKHIYEKLEAVNAPAAISKAYQQGILPTKKTSN
jgi:hypothetical protein